jgi:hypothetical protein
MEVVLIIFGRFDFCLVIINRVIDRKDWVQHDIVGKGAIVNLAILFYRHFSTEFNEAQATWVDRNPLVSGIRYPIIVQV